jgi:hypothetical protein
MSFNLKVSLFKEIKNQKNVMLIFFEIQCIIKSKYNLKHLPLNDLKILSLTTSESLIRTFVLTIL